MFKRVNREEYKVPADINYLGEMRDFITKAGRKYGVAERIINSFKLAIDEAATNIIRHAYRDWEGFITIRMIIRDKNVTVTMIDQGHTFDLRQVKDPDLKRYVEIGKKGGLGIFIIRRVIENIDYRKTVEGNELRLTKNREVSPRRRFIFPEIAVTMKTRFSLIASGILTFLILGGLVWNYMHQGEKILMENLESGRSIAKAMVRNVLVHLAKEETWELAKIAAEVKRNYEPLVVEAIVIDTMGVIQGAFHTDNILEPFEMPKNAIRIEENLFLYKTSEGKTVYDLIESALAEIPTVRRPIGTVHLLIDNAFIKERIASARIRIVWISGILLLAGYIGIFILVYVTMNPFKKLSKWVKALGHGEAHDEMEFNSSDEVGEIAQAFNEITEKFRKSQENLAEQERLRKEMQVAQEIQHTLLPAAFPEIEGYEIASYYEAAKEVGGDYFDFVEVDRDTLGIVVADVSGKGVPGSLVMTMIRTALRTEARGNKNAADVLSRVNDFVINDMRRGMFVTVFYIILDSQNRTISYASAGHNPMILYRGQTKKSYYLNPRGFPIGINLPDSTLFRKSIQSDTLRLKEGDILVAYTDGITEAMNPHRERYGDERFLSVLRKYGDLQVDPLVDKIKEEITTFTEGYSQSDDITLVAIREKMRAEEVLFNLRTRLMRMVNVEGISVKEACNTVGVSTSTYYKYKKRFEKMGIEGLKEKVVRSQIEEKHISIEDKAKLYDIIKEHPEYGAKRISEELKTEKYGFTEIDEKRIYEELVRSRLNTKELRLNFIEKGIKGKRMKPPGTPFLTLDGQIIAEPREELKPKVELPATAQKEKSSLEIKESEISEKEIKDFISEDLKDKKATTVNDLLDLTEETERTMEEEFLLDSDDTSESSTFSSSDQFDKPTALDKHPEIVRESEDVGDEKSMEFMLDDVFDELVTEDIDIDKKKKEDSPSVDEVDITLKQLLEMDKDEETDTGSEDQLENQITTSIAGQIIEEEIGKRDYGEGGGIGKAGKEKDDISTPISDEQEWEKLLENKFERRPFLESGLWFYRRGLYTKAIKEFLKAIEKNPDYIEAYQCLGDTFFRLGQLGKAKEAYERVKYLDPSNISVLENLGVIFANRGDYKKAVWQWGEVLKRDPARIDIIDRIKRMQLIIRQRSL